MGQSLRGYLTVGALYFVVLEAMLVAAILYWPNFEENVGVLKAMVPLDILKEMVDTLVQGGVAAYVTSQHFFKGCNSLGIAAAALLAAGAVAGEVHRGTFEIWLARPFTRRRLLLERWIGGALTTIVPVFLTTLTIPFLLSLVDEQMELGTLMLCALHESLFLLLIYSLSFLFSTFGSNPLGIALGVLFFCTLEFSLYLVRVVNEYSIYQWVDIDEFMAIVTTGTLSWRLVLPLLAGSALLLGLSLRVFSRRI
jgi:ABC-type transport system involved in multi-copper enzyme maturation permease subunit